MDTPTTEERVRKTIAEMLSVQPDDIKRETSFIGDLECDSLDHVEVIMFVEEEFGFEIPDDEAMQLLTFGALCDYIDKRLAV